MDQSKPEPNSMTITDAIALAVGVALALAFVRLPRSIHFLTAVSPFVAFLLKMNAIVLSAEIAVGSVVIGRVVQYRRMPRSPEWLALLIGPGLVAARQFSSEQAVRQILDEFPGLADLDLSMILWQWVLGGILTLPVVTGLLILRLARAILPLWSKTVLLISIATIAAVGPLAVLSEFGSDLLAPSGGFGPGIFWILYRQATILIAQVPLACLFGVPALAMFFERLCRVRWLWTEWVSFFASMMIGLALMLLYQGEFRSLSPAWLAERGLVLVWFLVVGLLSRWIWFHVGPRWNRWLGIPTGQFCSAPASSSSMV